MSEAILRRHVGGPLVMTDQLIRLMELAERPGVTIQLVPDSFGAFAGIGSPFSILSFREDRFDDVVYVDNLHADTWLEDECDREPYTQTIARLTQMALPAEDSVEIIANAVHQLQDPIRTQR